jgi:quercetin dioxygenase-like cupin family protein
LNSRTEKNSSEQWPWPDSLDALIAAPKYHRLLLENERVRVLEVRIGPGEIVPVHTHRWPSAVCVMKSSHFLRRDGEGNLLFDSRTAGPLHAGPIGQWIPPLSPHSVENIGGSEILLYTTELKEPV